MLLASRDQWIRCQRSARSAPSSPRLVTAYTSRMRLVAAAHAKTAGKAMMGQVYRTVCSSSSAVCWPSRRMVKGVRQIQSTPAR